MIFVSSSCVHHRKIKDSVLELVNAGFKNIELSGGTEYYPEYLDDLQELQAKYNLNYQLHNYFPPPKKHFVLNLASVDEQTQLYSEELIEKAVENSMLLKAKRFGFHAGFRINPKVSELGNEIQKSVVEDETLAHNRFYKNLTKLKSVFDDGNIKLYLENNVYSATNYKNFGSVSPFFLVTSDDYFKMKENVDFTLLLDVGHLKVSANVLKKDFEKEYRLLVGESNYLHLSDNDGLHDLNLSIKKESHLFGLIKETAGIKNKVITLELYDGISSLVDTYSLIAGLQ